MGTNRGGAILGVTEVVAGDTNYSLQDTSLHFATDAGLLATGVENLLAQTAAVTIIDSATVAQALAVSNSFLGILNLTAGLADTARNYAATDGSLNDSFIVLLLATMIEDVDIRDAATVAQAAMLLNHIGGTLSLGSGLADTAEHYATVDGALATGVAELLALDPDVTITDAASVAQLTAVDAATTGSLIYTGITDTAANLATYSEDDGWEVSGYLAEGIDVTVSGSIDAAELDLIDLMDDFNGDGTVTTAPTFLSEPNAYFIETLTTPDWTIPSHRVVNVIDAAGMQVIRIAESGKLNLIGADGHNVIVFENYALSDLTVTRSGATAIISITEDGTQIASIATDASYAPSQTLSFSDGSFELTNDGSALALDGVEIAVVGSIV